MTLDAGSRLDPGTNLPLSSAQTPGRAHRGDPEERLARLHSYFLEGSPSEVRSALEGVLVDARRVRDGFADDDIGDDLASVWYAGSALVELAAALELDDADVRGAAAAVADACALPLPAARFALFSQTVASPRLVELPPVFAIEIQLGLLIAFDVLADVTLWRRTPSSLECILSLGTVDRPSRRVRAEAKAALRQRSRLSLLGGSQLRSTPVIRYGRPYAAVVGKLAAVEPDIADAFLAVAATALGAPIEREHLLEH